MRVLGLVFVAVGVLILGVEGLGAASGMPTDPGADGTVGTGHVDGSILGGIATVIGLLMLAGGGRRD